MVAFNPQVGWMSQHQMSVNGKFEGITRSDLLAVAEANNIKNAAEVIDQVVGSVARWPRMALECGVPKDMVSVMKKDLCLV